MRNFKIILQYDGTRYQGWQRQVSTDNTIQGKLEALLSKMCDAPVEIQGAGRTDAGVHAYGQVANFHADTDKTPLQIMEYMNQYLPEDISVKGTLPDSQRSPGNFCTPGREIRGREPFLRRE